MYTVNFTLDEVEQVLSSNNLGCWIQRNDYVEVEQDLEIFLDNEVNHTPIQTVRVREGNPLIYCFEFNHLKVN